MSDPSRIAASLAGLPRHPTARLVFDKGQAPSDYQDAVSVLQPVATLLGTPVDSSSTKDYTVEQYTARFGDYFRAFSSQIPVWEVGNEVNGEWTGGSAATAAKTAAAFDLVHASGGRTALTLYYNPDCYSDAANAMLPWAKAELPDRVKTGVDYVLVSYYEGDCNGHQPSPAEWKGVFASLREVFPSARLGFGEVGAPKAASAAVKADYLRRYYTMPSPMAGFIGGYFWWYYVEDALPQERSPVWAALRAAMASSTR